jgi:hypothetical protein
MSTHLVDEDTINLLVTCLHDRHVTDLIEQYRDQGRASLASARGPADYREYLGHRLHDMNVAAVEDHYGEPAKEAGVHYYDYSPTELGSERGTMSPDVARRILGAAYCYHYQAMDALSWQDSLEQQLIHRLVDQLARELSVEWEYVESRDLPVMQPGVSLMKLAGK